MLLDYSPHTPTLQCSSVGLWPKCILLLRWSVFLTKKLLPSATGGFVRIHLIIQHNTAYFSSVIFKYYHTHFTFFSTSQPLHPLDSADCTRKKQPSFQFIHCSLFSLLQAPSRVLKLHCTWFSSSPDPVWYLSGLYTAYRLWIFFHSKHPE